MFSYVIRKWRGAKRELVGYQTLRRLSQSRHPAAGRIVNALRATRHNEFTAVERSSVDRIEALRARLVGEGDPRVTFVDFGAGDPGDHFSRGEMEQGRTRTRSLREVVEMGGLTYEWRVLLFHLIRQFVPSTCLELGTSVGMSAAYQGAGLEINGSGRMVTLEGGKSLAALAEKSLRELGLRRVTVVVGRFQDTLGDVLHDLEHVDFAFIDGHHDGEATCGYFEQILPYTRDGSILIFDDILVYETMQRAWRKLASDERVQLAIDLGRLGLCVIGSGAPKEMHEAQCVLS